MASGRPGLSPDIKSRTLRVDDLDMYILEALPPVQPAGGVQPPLVVLLHGFPELSYSWRQVMVPLSQAGCHVAAPDQRGYGRTCKSGDLSGPREDAPGPIKFDDDPSQFRMLTLVKDIVALVSALGYDTAAAVVGHDFGSAVAGFCALIRPDVFKSVVMMSAPFSGVAPFPITSSNLLPRTLASFNEMLKQLDPPRKHYMMYFCTREANKHMLDAPSLRAFLRAYFHMKSADWPRNNPHRLRSPAEAVDALPPYYIMPLELSMPEVVAPCMPSDAEIASNAWLTEDELGVYAEEFSRTGFQGGLNWYRCMVGPSRSDDAMGPSPSDDLMVLAGKKLEVPSIFIAGEQDWGVHQTPGALEKMTEMKHGGMQSNDIVLVNGAGHWVQQEQPDAVVKLLLSFLTSSGFLLSD